MIGQVKENLHPVDDNPVAMRMKTWPREDRLGRIAMIIMSVLILGIIMTTIFFSGYSRLSIMSGLIGLVVFLLILIPPIISFIDFMIILPAWGRQFFTQEFMIAPVDIDEIIRDVRKYAFLWNERHLQSMKIRVIIFCIIILIFYRLFWLVVAASALLYFVIHNISRRIILEAGLGLSVMSECQRSSAKNAFVWVSSIIWMLASFFFAGFWFLLTAGYGEVTELLVPPGIFLAIAGFILFVSSESTNDILRKRRESGE